MAPKSATRTGGDFLDFRMLCDDAEDGVVLVMCRIREFHEAESGDFGPILPVTTDVLICSGAQAGELHPDEKIIGAPTSTLRGVKNGKKMSEVRDPVNEIGDELMIRVELIQRGKGQPFVAFNVPSQAEEKAMLEIYEAKGGESLWDDSAKAEREPVAAGAGKASESRRRSWKD